MWLTGADAEVAYWRGYFDPASPDRMGDRAARLDPELEVQPLIARELPLDRVPRVLDCAAGPASTVGKLHEGERIELVCVDALADRYTVMLEELGVTAPVPSLQGEAEELDRFGFHRGFDVAYMRLALDHCHDPARAVRQMLAAVRPDGCVIIEHYRDPSRHEHFAGLRQWALDPEPGDLIVRNRHERFSLAEVVAPASVAVEFSESWLIATIRP